MAWVKGPDGTHVMLAPLKLGHGYEQITFSDHLVTIDTNPQQAVAAGSTQAINVNGRCGTLHTYPTSGPDIRLTWDDNGQHYAISAGSLASDKKVQPQEVIDYFNQIAYTVG